MRKLDFDVAVVGGGAAGVAAALGSSRAGAKTILIERNACFGGQATNSQVASFCGFYTRGNKPDRVVMGVGEEVLQKLKSYGSSIEPTISKSTGNASIRFDPELMKLAFDSILAQSSVKYLLHAQMIDVNIDNGVIGEITCIDDEGHFTVNAKSFIDASGNANLVNLAGIKTNWGDASGNVQQSSLSFRIDGLPTRDISKSELEEAIKLGKAQGIKNLAKETGLIVKIPNESYGYCTIPSKILSDLSAETMTNAEVELRQQVSAYAAAFRRNIPDFQNISVVESGPQIGIREARRIIGEATLYGEEIIRGIKLEDSVARGGWSPEMHKSNTSLEYTHIADNDYFSIPLGALKVRDAKNLWAAGRNISADSLALGSVRVMGTGFATGQGAGIAAALASVNGKYDIKSVQTELLKQNALI